MEQDLYSVLFGGPFCSRPAGGGDPAARACVRLVDELIAELRAEHGEDSTSFLQAEWELLRVQELPLDDAGILARRGVLLFALSAEPPLRRRLAALSAKNAALIDDLVRRVFPLIVPPLTGSASGRTASWQRRPFC